MEDSKNTLAVDGDGIRCRITFLGSRSAALGDRDSGVAHLRTLSPCEIQIDRKFCFSGGWNPVIGDEAPAHRIGPTTFGATLEAADGLTAHAHELAKEHAV